MILLNVVVLVLAFVLIVVDTSSDHRLFLIVGLVVLCFASSLFLLFPIPGLAAAVMGLVFLEGGYYDPFIVAIVATVGWSLGDAGIYIAGAAGATSQKKKGSSPGRVRRWINDFMDKLQGLTNRHAWMASVVLAALTFLPNPICGASLLAAGANRMHPAGFMSGVVVGRLARALVVAYAGSQLVNVG